MSSGTFYPAANGDTGDWSSSGIFSTLYSRIGKYPSDGGARYYSFATFKNVSIPRNAIIILAKAYVYHNGGDHAGPIPANLTVNLCFNSVDNAVPPTTAAEGVAMTYGDVVSWTTSNAPAPYYDPVELPATPDLKTLLQAVINREGWASGNSIMLFARYSGLAEDAGVLHCWQTYEHNSTYKPRLYVEWSTGWSKSFNSISSPPSIDGVLGANIKSVDGVE